jgi:hypothetical protein
LERRLETYMLKEFSCISQRITPRRILRFLRVGLAALARVLSHDNLLLWP